jgi:hypothetical protein
MAGNPGSSKWDLTNWTTGKVTLFQALGIKKGTISYPQLQTQLTTPAAESAQAAANSSSSSSGGSGAAGAGSAINTGVNEITGGNTTTPAGTSQTDWIKTLLTALGAPQTNANINSMVSWINHESPWNSSAPDGALYTNNPLNTKEPASGATTLSNGIKKYVNAASGIAATVATIQQYPMILAALRSGKGLCGSGLGPSFAKWSSNGYTSVC